MHLNISYFYAGGNDIFYFNFKLFIAGILNSAYLTFMQSTSCDMLGWMTHKLNIQKIKIMVSSPITSWQLEVEKVEAVTYFLSWAPKSLQTMTSAMKLRHLILGRKAMTKLDTFLKAETSLC